MPWRGQVPRLPGLWCDDCGDVGLVCDAARCDRHRCSGCGKPAETVDGGIGWCRIWGDHSGNDHGFCAATEDKHLYSVFKMFGPGDDVTDERRRARLADPVGA